MAAASSKNIDNIQLDDELYCPICFELYAAQSKKPKSLQCGHCYCEMCCINLYNDNIISCPLCNYLTVVDNAYALPTVFALLSLTEKRRDQALGGGDASTTTTTTVDVESSVKVVKHQQEIVKCENLVQKFDDDFTRYNSGATAAAATTEAVKLNNNNTIKRQEVEVQNVGGCLPSFDANNFEMQLERYKSLRDEVQKRLENRRHRYHVVTNPLRRCRKRGYRESLWQEFFDDFADVELKTSNRSNRRRRRSSRDFEDNNNDVDTTSMTRSSTNKWKNLFSELVDKDDDDDVGGSSSSSAKRRAPNCPDIANKDAGCSSSFRFSKPVSLNDFDDVDINVDSKSTNVDNNCLVMASSIDRRQQQQQNDDLVQIDRWPDVLNLSDETNSVIINDNKYENLQTEKVDALFEPPSLAYFDVKPAISRRKDCVSDLLMVDYLFDDNGGDKIKRRHHHFKKNVDGVKRRNIDDVGTSSQKDGPPLDIFNGFSFVLTSVITGPNVDDIDLKKNTDDDYPLFNKTELRSLIERCGGHNLPDFLQGNFDSWKSFLLSDKHHHTHKYMLAMAMAIPCVVYHWVYDCIRQRQLLDYHLYLLPAGYSLKKGRFVQWHRRCPTLLANKQVLIFSTNQLPPQNSNSPTISSLASVWAPIVHAMGGSLLFEHQDPADLNKELAQLAKLTKMDILLADATCPDWLLERARLLQASCVSSEWLIQAIINGKLPKTDSHPKYQFNSTED